MNLSRIANCENISVKVLLKLTTPDGMDIVHITLIMLDEYSIYKNKLDL